MAIPPPNERQARQSRGSLAAKLKSHTPYYKRVLLPRIPGYRKLDKVARIAQFANITNATLAKGYTKEFSTNIKKHR